MTTTTAKEIRERLEQRFASGWAACVAGPDFCMLHLAELDTKLAAIDPGYQVAQIKVKFRGLRFYIEHEYAPACCKKLDQLLTGADVEPEGARHRSPSSGPTRRTPHQTEHDLLAAIGVPKRAVAHHPPSVIAAHRELDSYA